MLCKKVGVIVDGLKKDKNYKGKITFEQQSAFTKENKKIIKDNGLGVHGILISDAKGKVKHTIDGHKYGKDKIIEGIKKVLKTKKDSK
jgi:hypothetical protein